MSTASNEPETRPAEQRLLEIASTLPGETIVATSVGRAQAAAGLSAQRPEASVTCWYLDSFQAALADQFQPDTTDIEILVAADFPGNDGLLASDLASDQSTTEPEVDLVAIPLPTGGEAELARDILQAGFANLKIGGHLVVSVDNPKDKWLHEQMKGFEKSVKVRPFEDAMVYFVEKTKPLKKIRDFSCELAFKDEDHLIELITRPGVFSHRKLDNGARQILDSIEVFDDSRLLDIGCGCGSIALAAAKRNASASVLAIDSHARAVDCTQRGIEKNGLTNMTALLNHDGQLDRNGQFDMVLANPPYYADFTIARHFIETAVDALRPDGRVMLVTKRPTWYEENLGRWLKEGEVFESRRYHIATGIKP
jgi:16S rRNA (guanine1207-N2)-methyltransferase